MDVKMRNKKPLRIKIISMGNAEVGKSCIIKRYCEKRFVSKYMTTIGIDYGVTKVNIKDREIKVNIFDMAGHPVFYEVRNEFYKDTQGVVLVFDVSDKSSFEALGSWMDELKRDIGDPADIEKITFIVCANKIDKKRVVDETESTVWAQQHGCHYFETSAQTGQGIQDMFQMLFNSVVVAVENGSKPSGPVNTTLGYTKEQIEAIQKLKSSRDNFERLGLQPGATKDEINKAYRKLAVIIHPDKSLAPGTEEAFKLLTTARAELMQKFR